MTKMKWNNFNVILKVKSPQNFVNISIDVVSVADIDSDEHVDDRLVKILKLK